MYQHSLSKTVPPACRWSRRWRATHGSWTI